MSLIQFFQVVIVARNRENSSKSAVWLRMARLQSMVHSQPLQDVQAACAQYDADIDEGDAIDRIRIRHQSIPEATCQCLYLFPTGQDKSKILVDVVGDFGSTDCVEVGPAYAWEVLHAVLICTIKGGKFQTSPLMVESGRPCGRWFKACRTSQIVWSPLMSAENLASGAQQCAEVKGRAARRDVLFAHIGGRRLRRYTGICLPLRRDKQRTSWGLGAFGAILGLFKRQILSILRFQSDCVQPHP